jgi:hypothetical protein
MATWESGIERKGLDSGWALLKIFGTSRITIARANKLYK